MAAPVRSATLLGAADAVGQPRSLSLHSGEAPPQSSAWPQRLVYAFPAFITLAGVAYMMGGANNLNMRGASLRIPPSWGPERERQYPFRSWSRDVLTWSLATDLRPEQIGPMVALQLAGAAAPCSWRKEETQILEMAWESDALMDLLSSSTSPASVLHLFVKKPACTQLSTSCTSTVTRMSALTRYLQGLSHFAFDRTKWIQQTGFNIFNEI